MPPVPDTLSTLARTISFVSLLQASGIVMFALAFGRLLGPSLPIVTRWGRMLAIAAIVFVAGHFVLEAGRMAGDMSGVADASLQMTALKSTTGAAFAVRMLGLALIALALGNTSHSRPIGLIGIALAVASFALAGHTSVAAHRSAAAGFLLIHLLAVSFWIGSLWSLLIASRRESPQAAGRTIEAFSAVAVWLVPFILIAGLGLMVLLLPDLAALSRPYGELLLLKVTVFAVLMALAALNKWKFGPRVARGDAGAARSFRAAVAIEYILICAVLAVTAVLTTFYSPEAA